MAFPGSTGFLSEFTDPTTIMGRELYLRALASALRNPLAIPDPSYALSKDINVYELVRRDAHVKKVMDQRKHDVAGTEWHCAPARDGEALDEAAAKLGEQLLGCIVNFDAAKLNLASAVFFGSAFAKIVGRRIPKDFGDGQMREWWVPEFLLDVDRRRFRWQPAGPNLPPVLHMGSIEGTTTAWRPLAHPEWLVQHVYDDTEATLGYGRGLMDSLYHSWYAKTKLRVEFLQAAERLGQGLLLAEILPDRPGSTGQTNETLLTDAADALAKTKARHALACFVGEKVSFVPGPQEGWQLLLQGLKYHDDEITGLVLGSVLPSGGGGGGAGEGGQGSMARAEVEQGTSDMVVRFDRRLLSSALGQVVSLCWRLNRANILACGLGLAEKPKVDLSHESRETPTEFAELLAKAQAAGVDVVKAEAYKRLGLTMPKPEDPVLAKPVVASPFGAGPGEPPPPSSDAPPVPPHATPPAADEGSRAGGSGDTVAA